MALGLVVIGMVAGVFTAGGVLLFGGGLAAAMMAYVSGGLVGILYGLVVACLPREAISIALTRNRG
ncbi:MAG: hypothetical protein MUE52_04070 [Tabrizicola sp.]|jgi:hypothetical protein|nr:hypothetical protein [Tabrizicola sp.]